MKIIKRNCVHHGITKFVIQNNGKIKCKKCRVIAVTQNRIKRKIRLVLYFGGKCKICGYNKCNRALHFHHINPKTKKFSMSASGLCRSWKKAIKEAKKCVLLCSNCHCEVESGLIKV